MRTRRVLAGLVLAVTVAACGSGGSVPTDASDPAPTTIRVTPAGAVDLTRSVVGDLEARNDALYGD